MKKKSVRLVGIVLVGAIVAFAIWKWVCQPPEVTAEPEKTPVLNKRIAAVKPAKGPMSAKDRIRAAQSDKDKKTGKRRRLVLEDTYSPADRKLADAVQSALDDDDLEQTRKAAAEAMRSENPEVRQEAVNALGWFGDKALVDLTKAMADKDPDVAEAARGQVENVLMGLEDDDRAVVLAGEYVSLFAEDEEAVTMFAGVLSSAGMRIIEPDDADSAEDVAKAKGNRAGIVDIVDEMIGKGGKLAEKGRELYEEITGDEWTDRATADKWANDIEESESDSTESEGSEN